MCGKGKFGWTVNKFPGHHPEPEHTIATVRIRRHHIGRVPIFWPFHVVADMEIYAL